MKNDTKLYNYNLSPISFLFDLLLITIAFIAICFIGILVCIYNTMCFLYNTIVLKWGYILLAMSLIFYFIYVLI